MKVLYTKLVHNYTSLQESESLESEYLNEGIEHISNIQIDFYYTFIRSIGVLQVIGILAYNILIWHNLYLGNISPEYVLVIDIFYLFIIYIIFLPNLNLLIILGLLGTLSPILQNLTSSFSYDTIIVLILIIFTLYLLSYNCNIIYKKTDISEIRHIATHNIAMFGSIILASRLKNILQIYSFLFFSIENLYFSCLIRRNIWIKSPLIYLYICTPLLNIIPLLLFNYPFNILYLLICIIIIIGSFQYVYCALKYKNIIKGPWDIAEIQC
ncbi:phosphatidylinositol-glycan-class c protein, putative [Cryptosporidium muris RN66]|uniref:Phosphatidylinositol-glycan-class c protein, putative n=1 Tax=Cryptosporidium muris (strain RN66) TaxID=441375 RepID=B6AJE0_CRYMR|nr:phosphatidylinositol-glycan-class c protein, putative [Cryptosporidium muris RN66]EEA08278.1 phosphatidylinositol-glycan-class c protein, putative [Cryptosporidium muris RN66]|eukprot:XP_002142627.1 phosphatidylinositol-glycan-class c protein [Cryptosporidium muris RN66]